MVSLKGFLRDRVFQGIMAVSVLFFIIPAVSNISMRQISELSISISLSLVSFVLLLLSIFIGGTTLWRDMERRYTFSVLGLPLSRTSYLFGRFLGVAACLVLAAVFMGTCSLLIIKFVSSTYPPDRAISWLNIIFALFFDLLKYLLLVGLSFLFSSFSTSFFLPVFSSISFFVLGTVSQQVYDYIHSPMGEGLSSVVRHAGTVFYYIIPNFTLFDLKSYAVYAIEIPFKGIWLPCGYFIVVLSIMLMTASAIFSKRDFK
jgi:ABC-type transport system involved in multi-copper enzyme maturation permease subunit